MFIIPHDRHTNTWLNTALQFNSWISPSPNDVYDERSNLPASQCLRYYTKSLLTVVSKLFRIHSSPKKIAFFEKQELSKIVLVPDWPDFLDQFIGVDWLFTQIKKKKFVHFI